MKTKPSYQQGVEFMLIFLPCAKYVPTIFCILHFFSLWLYMLLSFFQLHQPLVPGFWAPTQGCWYRLPIAMSNDYQPREWRWIIERDWKWYGLPWTHYINHCLRNSALLKPYGLRGSLTGLESKTNLPSEVWEQDTIEMGQSSSLRHDPY